MPIAKSAEKMITLFFL